MNSILPPPAEALIELPELRTRFSKTWHLGGNTFQATHSIAPVHWQDTSNTWQDYDLTVDPERHQVRAAPHQITVRDVGVTVTHFNGDTISIDLLSVGDRTSGWTINRSVNGEKITWSNLVDGLDITLEVTTAGIRFWQVLHHGSAPTSFRWQVTEGPRLQVLQPNLEIEGHDAQRRSLQLLPVKVPVTVDQQGNTSYTLTIHWTGNVKVRNPVNRNASWQPEAVYPVMIDPTVVASIISNLNDVTWAYHRNANAQNFSVLGATVSGGNYYYVPGWRFKLNVPQGVTVTAATLAVFVTGKTSPYSAPVSRYAAGTVYCVNSTNVNSWSGTYTPDNAPRLGGWSTAFSRPTTTGTVSLNVLTPVASRIANVGWAANNYIGFLMTSQDAPATQSITDFWDYHSGLTHVAQLSVTYTVGGVWPWFTSQHMSGGMQSLTGLGGGARG
jgi:hypothetical protein